MHYSLQRNNHNIMRRKRGKQFIMNIHKKKILEFLKRERVITSSELAKYIHVSWNTAEKYLLELVIEGYIEKIKKQGVNLWIEKK